MDEPEKPRIIRVTAGYELLAPVVLPFEIGNALTAMLKKRTLSPKDVPIAREAVQGIPVELREVGLSAALRLAIRFGIYAYDAYFLECALRVNAGINSQ